MMLLLSIAAACTQVPDPQGDDSGITENGVPSGEQLILDTIPVVVSSTPCDACGGTCLVEELDYPKSYHTTESIDYARTPPAGGPHNPCWSTWGAHAAAVLDDNFVHNLEHGGVAFVYAESALQGQVDALAKELGDYMITTPYTQQEGAMSALSWGWRLSLGCFDDATLRAFYADHVNQAPESLLAGPQRRLHVSYGFGLVMPNAAPCGSTIIAAMSPPGTSIGP